MEFCLTLNPHGEVDEELVSVCSAVPHMGVGAWNALSFCRSFPGSFPDAAIRFGAAAWCTPAACSSADCERSVLQCLVDGRQADRRSNEALVRSCTAVDRTHPD